MSAQRCWKTCVFCRVNGMGKNRQNSARWISPQNSFRASKTGTATIITRQNAVLCGRPWFDACFKMLDPDCTIIWFAEEGSAITAGQALCEIHGKARAMLSAERAALNFLQTLSATATVTRSYVEQIAGTQAKILDTRKTLPGMRIAQNMRSRPAAATTSASACSTVS